MNSLARNSVIFSVTLITLLITACGLPGSSKATVKQAYVLQGAQPSSIPDGLVPKPCLSLRVSQPESAPGFNTVRMAYRIEPNRMDYFAYHEWVATPARMMASLIETRLDESGLFGAIVAGSSDIRTDLRLDSEVLSLQQEFEDGTSNVTLAVKVNLVKVSNRSLINSRTFSYRVAADEQNAEAGVVAANLATERFLDDLARFVSSAVKPMECPRP